MQSRQTIIVMSKCNLGIPHVGGTRAPAHCESWANMSKCRLATASARGCGNEDGNVGVGGALAYGRFCSIRIPTFSVGVEAVRSVFSWVFMLRPFVQCAFVYGFSPPRLQAWLVAFVVIAASGFHWS